jgi:hypothetical protein
MTPKGKILSTHVIGADSSEVMLQPGNEEVAQLSFFVGDYDVHHVLLSRAELEKLGHAIVQLLKEGPSDAAQH